jgi:hypothetical protein
MADERPLRSKAFDTLERAVAPLHESATRCEPFANVATVAVTCAARTPSAPEQATRGILRFRDPPASSDLKRVPSKSPLSSGVHENCRRPAEGTNGQRNQQQ